MNIDCPGCSRKISERTIRCPYCSVEIQTPAEAKAGRQPTAEGLAAQSEKSGTPNDSGPGQLLGGAIALGIFSGIIGAVVVNGGNAEWLGLVIWIVGGVASQLMASVAVIAFGVALGMRVAHERGHND